MALYCNHAKESMCATSGAGQCNDVRDAAPQSLPTVSRSRGQYMIRSLTVCCNRTRGVDVLCIVQVSHISSASSTYGNILTPHHSTAEAIFVVQTLISQSPEIQKILAFEGAFERLFNIVASENGVDGGVVVQDALKCIDGLVRFNQSNQVGSHCALDPDAADSACRVTSAIARSRHCSSLSLGFRPRFRTTHRHRRTSRCSSGMIRGSAPTQRSSSASLACSPRAVGGMCVWCFMSGTRGRALMHKTAARPPYVCVYAVSARAGTGIERSDGNQDAGLS